MDQNFSFDDPKLDIERLGWDRRTFIRMVGMGTLASMGGGMRAAALDDPAFGVGIPADKKLKAEWVKALFERGEPEVFRGGQLGRIAMPIGGICAGQDVNLSGEGALIGWRVFAYPLRMAQGFTIRTTSNGRTETHPLDQHNFPDLTFRGEYPIAKLEYANAAIPVRVRLEAFSPFIPLEFDDSALPATVFNFTVENTSAQPVEVTLACSLENGICRYNCFAIDGTRRNRIADGRGMTVLDCTASSVPAAEGGRPDIIFDQLPDYGTMAMALMGPPAEIRAAEGDLDGKSSDDSSVALQDSLTGALGRTLRLKPGEAAKVTFIIAWHFPNLEMDRLGKLGRYYANKFASARAVAEYFASNLERLTHATRLWRDTWYDSTLPYWFLDRTFLNVSTLATSVCYRFANGRFYAYEGGPAPNYLGTCTHVWQYAHSVARVFPELERDTRERVDLGVALVPETGVIGFRGEYTVGGLAVDGQAGTIMRFYREHQMSPDNAFLKRNWDKIKLTYKPLFARDADEDGILEGDQNNTLDLIWYGQISWMSSMYVGALRAGEQMAREMGDGAFAGRCARIAANGTRNITGRLYNGEYFFNILDPKQAAWMNSGDGSHIDQVYGQSWAFQLGLPRILPEEETRTALGSIWKYNFSPDVIAYRNAHKQGRIFVSPGDAGMIMCTFPRTDWDFTRAAGTSPYSMHFAGYFNESWTGQEYQLASHMLWEGLTLEGMAITRAVHDRYHPSRRNPWAEEEAGIHYSRAMASHGVFIGACGFEYHGPLGRMAFAPRLTPENFRAPFIAAEGWGAYAQTIADGKMRASLEIKRGRLRLQTLELTLNGANGAPAVHASLDGRQLPVTSAVDGARVRVAFTGGVTIAAGESISIGIG